MEESDSVGWTEFSHLCLMFIFPYIAETDSAEKHLVFSVLDLW